MTDLEVDFRPKSGKIRKGLIAGELISLRDGEYILSTIRDITQVKQTERALVQSERRFRALIENSFDVVMMISPDGEVTYVSPSIRRVLGYQPHEFMELPRTDITHPDDVTEGIELFVQLLDQPEQPIQMTHRLRHKDGRFRMIEIVAVNMIDVTGVGSVVSNFRDVTERHEAEQHLRHERDFADTVINSLPGVFYVFDMDGGFLRWNENLEKITGYSRDELAVMSPRDFVREEERPLIDQAGIAVFELGSAAVQAQFLAKDGSTTPFFLTGIRFISDGKPLLIGIGIDVSEQHAAESALRQHAKRLEVINEIVESVIETHSSDQIAQAVLSRLTDLVPCQRCSVALFDRQAEWATMLAIHGAPETRMQPGLSVPVDLFGDVDSLRQGTVFQVQDLHRELDRSPVYQSLYDEGVRAFASLPLLVEGDLVGTLNLGMDSDSLTDEHLSVAQEVAQPLAVAIRKSQLDEQVLRHAEELEQRVEERTAELAEATDRFRLVVEAMPNAVIMIDPDGLIQLINAEGESLFGYSRDELVGQPVEVLVPNEYRDDHPAQRLAYLKNPQARAMGAERDLTARRRDGSEVPVEIGLNPLWIGGQTFVLAAIVDITQRKRSMVELAQARERAESADRLKSAFLATMSHELRTPLNSIIGFTGIMVKGLTGPLNDEQTKQLGMVQNSARHLLSLINDVLDISKIEAGQFEIGCQQFSFRDSIEKTTETCMPAAKQKNLTLSTQVEADVGDVIGDQRRVEQILINLINNAIKFTETGTICVASKVANGRIVTSVTDTGCGIETDDVEKLFEPFQQLDSRIGRQHEGSGLGLAICKRLLELMGGEIQVTSRVREGSTFSFSIPVNEIANIE